MEIELSYRFSKLDKTYCFGLVFNSEGGDEIYIRWVWYHLGRFLTEVPDNFILYPFSQTASWIVDGKIIKTYKFCNSAERQALLLAKAMVKIMNKK